MSDSNLIEIIKDEFKRVDNRFNRIDKKIDDIKENMTTKEDCKDNQKNCNQKFKHRILSNQVKAIIVVGVIILTAIVNYFFKLI